MYKVLDHIELEEERHWIAQAKKDVRHFQPLYSKYYHQIFRFIYRRTDDEALTADLCSQTFYKALSGIRKYKWQNKPFSAWLYTIALNELRKHFRHKPVTFLIEEDKIRQHPDLGYETKDIQEQQLIAVFRQLHEDEIRLIELKFFEENTFKEISAILNINESTVKMRLYRLLEKMKRLMGMSYDEV